MAKKTGARENIKLILTISATIDRTSKNKRNTTERLQIKKYDPVIRKHVNFKEEK